MGRKNNARGLIEVLEQRRLMTADLAGSLSLAVAAYSAGSNVSAQFKLVNNGSTTVTTNFSINFRLSVNNVYGDGDEFGSVNVPVSNDIPPGGISIGVGVQIPIPADLPAGSYHIVGKVDSANNVSETNENNNTFGSTGAGTIEVLDSTGRLVVEATDNSEVITISKNPTYAVQVGDDTKRTYGVNVQGVVVDAAAGSDVVFIQNNAGNCSVFGGDGDDKIVDTGGSNTLAGGAGKDSLYGGDGNDRLNGNGGNDRLNGEGGSDRMYGYDGNDVMDGGSSRDRFYGGAGVDICYGQSGDDLFYVSGDGSNDSCFGATGNDGADADPGDVLGSVEVTL
jgi:Ca2+-binding RTX toxin-like protein